MQLRYLLFAAISFYLSLSPSCFARGGIIPAPVISVGEMTISPSQTLTISGTGFIRNLPNAHRVLLYNEDGKFPLNILRANADFLVAELPDNLKLGDYRSKIRIKSRLLCSPLVENSPLVRLRPVAPRLPELRFQAASNTSEINQLFKSLIFQGLALDMHLPESLAIGANPVKFSYSVNGFTSVASEAVNFYYLPQDGVKPELIVGSTNPLTTYAEAGANKIDISSITEVDQDGPLNSFYYLTTPSIEKYLLHSVLLSPIFISVVHAGDPEFVTIHNRNNKDFDLSGCAISDSLKSRYSFAAASKIAAGADLKIEANLSLNNDGDTVSVICKDTVIDSLSYKSIDVDGYIVDLSRNRP